MIDATEAPLTLFQKPVKTDCAMLIKLIDKPHKVQNPTWRALNRV